MHFAMKSNDKILTFYENNSENSIQLTKTYMMKLFPTISLVVQVLPTFYIFL